jgi:penicillin-binding protein 1C
MHSKTGVPSAKNSPNGSSRTGDDGFKARPVGSARIVKALALSACVSLVTVAVYNWLPDYGQEIETQRSQSGMVVVDRHNRILRIFPDSKGRLTLWRSINEFPECLKLAVIAAEDKRFYRHPGFDPVAIVRAFFANIKHRRTVSGASTITQQVVRLIRPRPRTYLAKFIELLESVKMECQLSKDQILELYLNLSPMGGNIRGARLAARVYFGKDIKQINISEAAALAALPRSPSRYDPRNKDGRKLLLKQRDRILTEMIEQNHLLEDTVKSALSWPIDFRISGLPLEAPHFVDFVMSRTPDKRKRIRTTLDLDLQKSVEAIFASHKNRLRRMGIRQSGALIASTGGETLSMVGSLGYGWKDQGFNNAVLSSRSAGSTLKPFLYAMALEKGNNAATEIADTFRAYRTPQGDYLPLNADRRFYGPVSIRSALGNSLNISAVKTAGRIGTENFYQLLESLGLASDKFRSAGFYGLGLAVGNLEVSLYHLVQAYSALALEGEYQPLTVFEDEKPIKRRVFTRETAYMVSHILADPSARLLTFGNPSYFDFGHPVAVKTGTSSGFRDCWVVAYTPKHVIGIWAGNFNGSPSNGASGSAACGPILQDLIRRLYRDRSPGEFIRPAAVKERFICSMSGKLASSRCPYKTKELFVGNEQTITECDLPHDDRAHHLLGGPYAHWIYRREKEQGRGRFRLMQPHPVVTDKNVMMTPSSSFLGKSHIEIVSPQDADRFVLSSRSSNRVLLRAIPEPVVEYVIWLIDGFEVARVPPPYELAWEATRGKHTVHAVTPNNTAAKITIQVE